MAKPAMVLAALFFLIALSRASELQKNDVITVDLSTPVIVGTFDQVIELPTIESDKADQIQPDREPADSKVPESSEELTTDTFRPGDHNLDGLRPMRPVSLRFPFRHRKPCRHGRRPFKPTDLPYGNDNKGSGELEGQRATQWVRFHHYHGKPRFGDRAEMMEMVPETDRSDKTRHHNRFEMQDEEEREGHHHHHHHRHHHHHHHHDHDEEEEGGFLGKIRKFLMDGF